MLIFLSFVDLCLGWWQLDINYFDVAHNGNYTYNFSANMMLTQRNHHLKYVSLNLPIRIPKQTNTSKNL